MESVKSTKQIRSAFTALFAGLLCLGCFVSIPLPDGIPITIQNMFAALSGLLMGGLQGAGAVGLFLVLGAAGLPVFSGVKGGISVIQGPTGGFLVGYFMGALVGGIIVGSPLKKEKKSRIFLIRLFFATVVAFAMQYLFGIPWFMASMESAGKAKPVSQLFTTNILPLIPGDIVKMFLSFVLSLFLRPIVARYLYPDDEREAEELIRKLETRKSKLQK